MPLNQDHRSQSLSVIRAPLLCAWASGWWQRALYNHRPNRIAYSYDGGFTWNRWEESTAGGVSERQHSGNWRLVNGRRNKASPGSVAVLPDGKVLITYGYRAYPFGVRAILSHDGGETFLRPEARMQVCALCITFHPQAPLHRMWRLILEHTPAERGGENLCVQQRCVSSRARTCMALC